MAYIVRYLDVAQAQPTNDIAIVGIINRYSGHNLLIAILVIL